MCRYDSPKQHFILQLLLIHLIFVGGILSYACISPSGNEVDWFVGIAIDYLNVKLRFVAYKLPDLDSRDPQLASGIAFLYADSRSNSWMRSNASVVDRTSAIGLTVSQLFQAKRDKVNIN
jgi:hypothetical protein